MNQLSAQQKIKVSSWKSVVSSQKAVGSRRYAVGGRRRTADGRRQTADAGRIATGHTTYYLLPTTYYLLLTTCLLVMLSVGVIADESIADKWSAEYTWYSSTDNKFHSEKPSGDCCSVLLTQKDRNSYTVIAHTPSGVVTAFTVASEPVVITPANTNGPTAQEIKQVLTSRQNELISKKATISGQPQSNEQTLDESITATSSWLDNFDKALDTALKKTSAVTPQTSSTGTTPAASSANSPAPTPPAASQASPATTPTQTPPTINPDGTAVFGNSPALVFTAPDDGQQGGTPPGVPPATNNQKALQQMVIKIKPTGSNGAYQQSDLRGWINPKQNTDGSQEWTVFNAQGAQVWTGVIPASHVGVIDVARVNPSGNTLVTGSGNAISAHFPIGVNKQLHMLDNKGNIYAISETPITTTTQGTTMTTTAGTPRVTESVDGRLKTKYTYKSSDPGAKDEAYYTADKVEVSIDGKGTLQVPAKLDNKKTKVESFTVSGVQYKGTTYDWPSAVTDANRAAFVEAALSQGVTSLKGQVEGQGKVTIGRVTLVTASNSQHIIAYGGSTNKLSVFGVDGSQAVIKGTAAHTLSGRNIDTTPVIIKPDGSVVLSDELKNTNEPFSVVGKYTINNVEHTTATVRARTPEGDIPRVGRFTDYNPDTDELQYGSFTFSNNQKGTTKTSTGPAGVTATNYGFDSQADFETAITTKFGPNAKFRSVSGDVVIIDGDAYQLKDGDFKSCGYFGTGNCDEQEVEEAKIIFNYHYEALNEPGLRAQSITRSLDSFVYYAQAYEGLAGWSSIMGKDMDKITQRFRAEVDRIFCDQLGIGGTDCWTSKICDEYVDVENTAQAYNVLVGRSPDGSPKAVAHIEAEKSAPIRLQGASRQQLADTFGERIIAIQGKSYNLSDENEDVSAMPPITAYMYRITYYVSPQEGTEFSLQLSGSSGVSTSPPKKVSAGAFDSATNTNPIHFITPNDYNKVCLTFNPSLRQMGGGTSSTIGSPAGELCTRISAYAGGATAPPTQHKVSDSPNSQQAGSLRDWKP